MKRGLERALDECLSQLNTGEYSLEEVLARYPEYEAELRPLLRTAMLVRQVPRVVPSSEAKAAGRRRLLAAVAKKRREKARARPGLLRRLERSASALVQPLLRPQRQPLRWAQAIAALLIIVSLVSAGTVGVAARSLPDSPLYPIKRTTERVRLTLTTSAVGKARLHMSYSQKRLDEARTLWEADKGLSEATLKDMESESSGALAAIGRTSEEERPDLLADFARLVEKQQETLEEIKPGVPPSDQEAVEEAIEAAGEHRWVATEAMTKPDLLLTPSPRPRPTDTATSVPPTHTATPVPPTYTATSVPPTSTPIPVPTATSVPPTATPIPTPTEEPTSTPQSQAPFQPTVEPTAEPTPEPTATNTPQSEAPFQPTVEPTAEPTLEPTATPVPTPTVEPTTASTPQSQAPFQPTEEPTAEPTPEPTATPTPTPEPTATPTPVPPEPTATNTPQSQAPFQPTVGPTAEPTLTPTVTLTLTPTVTLTPTFTTTPTPTATPTPVSPAESASTPQAGMPFQSLTASSAMNCRVSDAPRGAAVTEFVAGTGTIYMAFDCVYMAGEEVEIKVYDNSGSVLFGEVRTLSEDGAVSLALSVGEGGFAAGRYVVNVYKGGGVIRTVIWDVA